MSIRKVFCAILSFSMFLVLCHKATAGQQAKKEDDLKEWNNQIRREKFDHVLPEAMRKNNIDIWIHVMRETISDPFGAEELGSTSGVFIFTDRRLPANTKTNIYSGGIMSRRLSPK